MNRRGMFIAFEGIDGSGKSTLIKRFVNYLFERDKHNHVVLTRNPYKDADIRAILRADNDALSRAEKLAELFIGDRKMQAEEVVIPSLAKGLIVVTDRYKLSTVAYQAAQGLDISELIQRQNELTVPDITFIVDVPINVAAGRMAAEAGRNEHKFERNKDFLENVRQNYLRAAELLSGEKIFIVNGAGTADEVFEETREIFEKFAKETFL